MLQELVQIEFLTVGVLTIIWMCQAATIQMLYPALHRNLSTASKPKLERIRVQANLAEHFSDEKL